MSHEFFIYVKPDDLENDDEEITIFCHHLIGYCSQTYSEYGKMIATLREDFPEAKDEDIGCHHIVHSHCYKGFTLIVWKGTVKKSRLNLPSPAEYAKLIEEKEANPINKHLEYLFLPKWQKWRIDLHGSDYNY